MAGVWQLKSQEVSAERRWSPTGKAPREMSPSASSQSVETANQCAVWYSCIVHSFRLRWFRRATLFSPPSPCSWASMTSASVRIRGDCSVSLYLVRRWFGSFDAEDSRHCSELVIRAKEDREAYAPRQAFQPPSPSCSRTAHTRSRPSSSSHRRYSPRWPARPCTPLPAFQRPGGSSMRFREANSTAAISPALLHHE